MNILKRNLPHGPSRFRLAARSGCVGHGLFSAYLQAAKLKPLLGLVVALALFALHCAAQGPTALINETLANTTTAGDQQGYYWSARTVVVQPAGTFILVWIDKAGTDGQGKGIFGQRFDANGAKAGGQFQVNTTTAGDQDNATVAVAPNGSFIVGWDGPGSGLDVFAQRFTKDGVKLGDEFLLNTTVSGGQKYPEMAFFPDGTFVAAFVEGSQTVLQRFDARGRTLGLETRISSGGGAVVMDSLSVRYDNTVVLSWTDAGDMYGQLFTSALQPIGTAQRLNQYTTGTQEYSISRVDGKGNIVVVWESVGQDGSGMGMYGRRFDANFSPLGNEFAITTNTINNQFEPQVAVHASGRFVVVWSDNNNRDGGGTAGGDAGTSCWMREFDANGTPVGSESMVNQSTAGYQAYPVIDVNQSGRVVVSWEGNGTQAGQTDSYGVFVRSYQLSQTGTTAIAVDRSTATAGDLVTVTMTLTAPAAIANVYPNPPNVLGQNGVFATLVSGPTPSSATVGPAPVTFTWTYKAVADASSGQLSFGGSARSEGGAIFPYAASAAIHLTPALYLSDLTGPNLIGDSNVGSQPNQGPRVFTIGTKIINPSTNTLTDVMIFLGDGVTPGAFPATVMTLGQTHNTYQGAFALDLLAATGDATRPLITLGPAKTVIAGGIDFNGDGVVNGSDDGALSNGKTVVDGRVDVNLSGTVTADDDLPLPPGVFYGYREPAIIDGCVDIDGDGVVTGADGGTYGGEVRNLYWQVAYDVLDASGTPTWGNAQDIGDDLRYDWTVWGTARDAGVARVADYNESVRVRNEISANANKITPSKGYISGGPPRVVGGGVDINSDGVITAADDGFFFGKRVIDGTVDVNNSGAISTADDGELNGFPVIDGRIDLNRDGVISFRDDGILVQTGQTFTVTVHDATFGTIGQGFDENRDNLWDIDFWHQPVGEVEWPAGSFRLIDIQSEITGAGGANPLNGITTHYNNEPYLSRLFDDRLNQSGGFDGTYTYTFLVMGEGSGFLSPYQEAASGSNNEKYNGDYGVGVQVLTGLGAPGLLISKTGSPDPTLVGGTTTWTMTYQNVSSTPAGEPGTGNGVVIEDAVPTNTTYVAGSATAATNPCTVYYSADGGASWSSAAPAAAAVNRLRWHVEQSVPAGGGGAVSFQTTVNSGTPNFSRISNQAEIKLGAGQVLNRASDEIFVGAAVPASLSGTVKADTDHNATGDSPLAGVTLRIYTDPNGDGDPGDGALFTQNPADSDGTVTTAADGTYSFGYLLPGNYVVVQTDPSGYTSVSDGDATADSVGSPADAANTDNNNNRLAVNLAEGETDSGNDFVDEQYGAVTGHLFYDAYGHGTPYALEPGIAHVRVYIDSDGSGTYSAGEPCAMTAADGMYLIGELAVGSPTVRVDTSTLPAGLIQTYGLNGVLNPAAAVTLTAGATRADVDFGYRTIVAYAIRGQVRDDYRMSGNLNDADRPVGGVLVSLFSDPNGDGSPADGVLIARMRTTPDGRYAFTNVMRGVYVVVESDPVAAVSTADKVGSNDNRIPVAIVSSDSVDNDFLDAVDPAGYLYDVADGRIVPGGSIAVSGPGAQLLMDGSSGQYMFISTNNAPATYTIAVTPPPGYLIDPTRPAQTNAFDPTGGAATTALGSYESAANPGYLADASAASNTYYYSFDLAPGDPLVINNNFPLVKVVTVGDRVWTDMNGNGAQDAGEPGVTNATVRLLSASSNVVATTVTDASGSYLFTNLPPATYQVEFVAPAPYVFTACDAAVTNDLADSDADRVTGRTAPVIVAAGTTNLTLDAGLYVPAVLYGYLFGDRDGDLLRRDSDIPISSSLVRLVVNGTVVDSTNTDAAGYYSFVNVAPGAVSVLVSRVSSTLISVPSQEPAASDVTRNRALPDAQGLDAYIPYSVASGYGVLASLPGEPLNFGFSAYTLSTAMDISLRSTGKGGVMIELWTSDEAGCADIAVSAWLDNAWVEVGRVPAEEVVGEGSNRYSIHTDLLSADGAYFLKIVDETGREHFSSQPVTVKSLRVDAVRMNAQTLTVSFNTEARRAYVVMVSTDLVRWTAELVSAPTADGWSAYSDAPFTAAGESVQVRVQVKGRKQAYFKVVLAD